jgi:carbamate kinase
MERQGIAVVAVGGNALIKDKAHQTVQDQFNCAKDTMTHIVDMIEKGWDVVVTHGNGPQVGFILRRSELARHELHEIPVGLLRCRYPGRHRIHVPECPAKRV